MSPSGLGFWSLLIFLLRALKTVFVTSKYFLHFVLIVLVLEVVMTVVGLRVLVVDLNADKGFFSESQALKVVIAGFRTVEHR